MVIDLSKELLRQQLNTCSSVNSWNPSSILSVQSWMSLVKRLYLAQKLNRKTCQVFMAPLPVHVVKLMNSYNKNCTRSSSERQYSLQRGGSNSHLKCAENSEVGHIGHLLLQHKIMLGGEHAKRIPCGVRVVQLFISDLFLFFIIFFLVIFFASSSSSYVQQSSFERNILLTYSSSGTASSTNVTHDM